jgi:hypothetical protein
LRISFLVQQFAEPVAAIHDVTGQQEGHPSFSGGWRDPAHLLTFDASSSSLSA